MDFSPKFEWASVLTRTGRSFCFGGERRHLTNECQQAAVYRWIFHPSTIPATCLVGSTEDLHRRIGEYKSHSSDFHKNVRKAFAEHCSGGGTVVLETLRFDPFTINGVEFSEKRLVDPFIREALEKILCADLQKQGLKLLNSTLQTRFLRKLMSLHKNSTPEEFAELIRLMESKAAAGE